MVNTCYKQIEVFKNMSHTYTTRARARTYTHTQVQGTHEDMSQMYKQFMDCHIQIEAIYENGTNR